MVRAEDGPYCLAAEVDQRLVDEERAFTQASDAYADLQQRCTRLEAEKDALIRELDAAQERNNELVGRMSDHTGHTLRCAKVNGVWACANVCAIKRAEHAEAQVADLTRQRERRP